MMLAESWFDHDETVQAGLADEVVKPDKKAKAQLAPPKFSDQLAEAVASLEKVAAEAENVITFRSEQGKPPLSDDAVALVDKAVAALTVLQAEPEQPAAMAPQYRRDLELIETEAAALTI